MDIYDSYKHITPESIMLCHITKAPIVFDIFIWRSLNCYNASNFQSADNNNSRTTQHIKYGIDL